MNAPAQTRFWPLWAWSAALLVCCFGCMPMTYTAPPPPPAPPVAAPPPPVARPVFFVTGQNVNLRACPGMDCPPVGRLDRNEEVEKLGDSEDWSQVRIKRTGTLGWVATRYLSIAPLEAAPAPPPLPGRPATPETAKPERPPLPEKPPETAAPPPRKKPAEETTRETRPKSPKPAEAAEPPSAKPAERPAPVQKAPPPEEKKAPAPAPAPAPEPEQKKGIRIM